MRRPRLGKISITTSTVRKLFVRIDLNLTNHVADLGHAEESIRRLRDEAAGAGDVELKIREMTVGDAILYPSGKSELRGRLERDFPRICSARSK